MSSSDILEICQSPEIEEIAVKYKSSYVENYLQYAAKKIKNEEINVGDIVYLKNDYDNNTKTRKNALDLTYSS